MAAASPVQSSKRDDKSRDQDRQAADDLAAAFGARLREAAEKKDISQTELARLTGTTKQSMGDYWNGKRVCGSDKLFAIADALDVSARWLMHGGSDVARPAVMDVAESDFVYVPRFDLTVIAAEGSRLKPLDTVPIRRDWLFGALRRSSGLWLAEMPTGALPDVAREGDTIVCEDVGADLVDGKIYVFARDHQVLVRRVSISAAGYVLRAGDPSFETIVLPHKREPPAPEDQFVPIARILASYAVHPV